MAKQNLIFRILFLSDFLYFIAQAIEHFIIKNADIVIALMPYLGSVAKRKGAKKVIIIPNGVDFKLIKKYSIYSKEELRRKLKIPLNKKVLLVASRLVPLKRVDMAIRALKKIKEERDDIVLYILGDGPERPRLEKLVDKLGLSSNVYFMGCVSHEDVLKYMLSADLLIHTSVIEGHSKTIIEAMACKCPIIASNTTGIKDILRNDIAILFDDEEDLANKIKYALNSQDILKRLSSKAYIEAERRYDLNECEKKNRVVI